jgi:hypothetical protein
MPYSDMQVKILLPFRVFAEKTGVLGLVAETEEGALACYPIGETVWRDCARAYCRSKRQ